MRRWTKRLIGITLVFGVVIAAGIHFIAPYAIIQPMKQNLAIVPGDKAASQEIKIPLADSEGKFLSGYWIYPKDNEVEAVIVLLHGIGGCKEHYLDLANYLAQQNIASVVLDNRAHGVSDGDFCTYGFYEKKDVANVLDFIEDKKMNVPIGIWGNSMGGAIALQALALDSQRDIPRLDFGIVESSFANLRQIVSDYQKRLSMGVRLKFITDYTLDRAGIIGGFDPDEVNPLRDAGQISVPVFVAHGDADKNISYEYGRALYDNLESASKSFYLVKGGGHFDLYEFGGKAYTDSLFRFIKKNVEEG